MIACCKANGIMPIVTLYHFSSPAWLIGKGGWGKEYVVGAFAKYVRYVAEHLGKELTYMSYGRKAAEVYKNAKYVELPGETHGFMGKGKKEAAKLTYQFLERVRAIL